MNELAQLFEGGSLLVMFALIIWTQERMFGRVLAMLEEKNRREFERWQQLVNILTAERDRHKTE